MSHHVSSAAWFRQKILVSFTHAIVALSAGVLLGATLLAAPDFRGVIVFGREVSVALAAGEDAAPRWVRVGETFDGYRVAAFDAPAETVVLLHGTDVTRLRLKHPHASGETAAVVDAVTGPAPRIRENLRQLAVAAAHYFRTTPARSDVSVADLVGPDRLLEVLRPVAGEDYSALRLSRNGSSLSVVTTTGEMVTLDAREATVAASRYHLTGEGDSIDKIARATGQSVQRILEFNELAEPGGNLRSGRLLRTQ